MIYMRKPISLNVLDKSVVFKSLMVLDVWSIATSRAP